MHGDSRPSAFKYDRLPGPYGPPESSLAKSQHDSGERPLKPPAGVIVASICGGIAAIFYTVSNIALRGVVGVDPFLVSAVKAAPTVIFLSPYLVWMGLAGHRIATSWSMAPRFLLVALIAQFIGNASFQVALGSIGLAASVPITLGVLIGFGAVLGWWVLGEPVRLRSLLAMVILVTAVVVLSSPGATQTPATSETPIPTWLGAGCAAASGAAFGLFGTVMRQTLNGGISAPMTIWISGMVGTVTLWTTTLVTTGADGLMATSGSQWAMMAAGGLFNFTAFVALSVALKALPITAVNLINTSQVAMAAVAGVVIFGEPVTTALVVGVVLTAVGLTIIARRKRVPLVNEPA